MQRVDRGGGRRPAGVVLLILVAIVGAGIAGRLGEAPGEETPSVAVASPTPNPTESASGGPDAGFTSMACPPPSMSIVRADRADDAAAASSRLTTVAPSAAWLDLVAAHGPAGDRSIWLLARGRLVRLDGTTLAPTRSWSYTDSPIWAPDGIAPDGRNGVYMWDSAMVRDVTADGAVPVAPVPTPSRIAGVAAGPDGAPWIAEAADGSAGSALLRHDAVWTRMRPCEPSVDGAASTSAATIAADPAGRLVVVDAVGGSVRIRRFDGLSWMAYVGMAGLGDPQASPSVSFAPDGTVYVATGRGVGRFDGSSWSSVATRTTRIVVLDSGSLAAFAPTVLGDTAMTHLDGMTLQPLPDQSSALFEGLVTGAATSSAGLVVATPAAFGTGLAVVRFQTPGRSLSSRSVAADVPWLEGARDRPGAPLLALSRREAWFGSWEGIAWHLASDRLIGRDISAGAPSTIRALARGADGSVWIGHDADLTVIRPSGTSVLGAVQAVSVAARPDGKAWLLGADGVALLGSLTASGVVIDAIARPPFDWGARIVADADGSAWALGGALTGPDLVVVHLVGGRWTVVPRPLGAAIITIARDPRHGIWALASRPAGRVLLLRDEGDGWRSAGDVPMLAATDLAVGPNGIVWVAGDALARTDGAGHWETVAGSSSIHDTARRFYAPSVAPDGTVYVVCPSGICRYDPNAG